MTASPELVVISYVRVSTKEQAERDGDPEGYSIPAQREACERRARSLGTTVAKEFLDRGESAKTADRPGLRLLLAYVASSVIAFRIASNPAADAAMPCPVCATTLAAVSVPVTMPSDTGQAGGAGTLAGGARLLQRKSTMPPDIAGLPKWMCDCVTPVRLR